mmetsp:Transcript_6514/g.12175  ORF Transcript_6514/g.12175 Transcript_6514/m.12175 type:complete len:247 (-) Transcript_6514:1930-2670(-)
MCFTIGSDDLIHCLHQLMLKLGGLRLVIRLSELRRTQGTQGLCGAALSAGRRGVRNAWPWGAASRRHLVLLCHRQQCPRTIGHRVSDHQELYISDTLQQSAVDKSGGLNARKWTARLGTRGWAGGIGSKPHCGAFLRAFCPWRHWWSVPCNRNSLAHAQCGGVKDVQPDAGEWEVSSCSMLVQRYTGVAQIACQIGRPRGRAHCMKLGEKCLDSFRTAHPLVSSAPHCFRTYLCTFSPGPGAMQRQ